MPHEIAIGGMIAGGFDSSGEYLLTVSHSGRAVFAKGSWERIARDHESAYPDQGHVVGIGPIAGVSVKVHEMDYATEEIQFLSPDGKFSLHYAEGTLAISFRSK